MPASRRVISAFVVLAACGAGCRRSPSKDAETEPPIPVVAEPVQIGNIRGVVSATAVVEALPGADFMAIAPESGRIVEVLKIVGDKVTAGDVLVRFEFPSLRAEIAAREASAKNADVRVQTARVMQARVHKLLDLGAASQREAEVADAEVSAAEAEIAQARAAQVAAEALSQRTTIRAPFTGVVSERLHNPGDLVGVATNDVILRVIDPRQVEVVASVSVANASRFAAGASARGVTATRSRPEILRVISRDAAEPGATAVLVRLGFIESTELTPGVQLGVEIDAEQRSNVPLVPAISVVKDGNASAVFVVAGDQARKRPVVPGLIDTERVEILSGVRAGEMVITQGQSNLRDGSAITTSP